MRKNGSGGGQFLTYFLLLREEENSYPEAASKKVS